MIERADMATDTDIRAAIRSSKSDKLVDVLRPHMAEIDRIVRMREKPLRVVAAALEGAGVNVNANTLAVYLYRWRKEQKG